MTEQGRAAAPRLRRLKARYSQKSRYVELGWALFRFLLLVGLSFVILYPFLSKISSAFMSSSDVIDQTVWFIPRSPTLDNIRRVLEYGSYWEAFRNTFLLSFTSAVVQTFICAMVGYGFAKFKFRGRGIFFAVVIMTIVIPPSTIYTSTYLHFRFFDIFGLAEAVRGEALNLVDSIVPVLILSFTALALKNGLFIFVMRQFYRGVPYELNEAALVDGCGPIPAFFRIILPLSTQMMASIFILSFSWQWTDTFYADMFYRKTLVLPKIPSLVQAITGEGIFGETLMSSVMVNTAVLLIVLPLFILFIFMQRFLVQGIERSGIAGM